MNFLRLYKLKSLGIEPNSKTLKLIKFIEENTFNLTLVENTDYPNFYFYFKGKKCILEYDKKYTFLYVRYKGFWDVLNIEYNLNFNEIEIIMKYLVETNYKLPVSDVSCRH